MLKINYNLLKIILPNNKLKISYFAILLLMFLFVFHLVIIVTYINRILLVILSNDKKVLICMKIALQLFVREDRRWIFK